MKHVKIVNRKNGETLPLTAAPCSTFNICFFGDWDECGGSTDFCMKDGVEPKEEVDPHA